MDQGGSRTVHAVMAALYLRGGPVYRSVWRRRWGHVRDALCSSDPPLGQASAALRSRGLWDEAAALDRPGVLDWGWEQAESARALSVVSPGYPARWLRVLGSAAPPCLWVQGEVPSGPTVAVVGNRFAGEEAAQFARECGAELMKAGRSLVSGGAPGVDLCVQDGALSTGGSGRVLVVLPCGIAGAAPADGVCHLSLAEPTSPFSPALAMERNALVHASSPLSVVVRAQSKSGGTWNGALEALRKRSTTLAVRAEDGDEAAEALLRLGALPLSKPDEVPRLAAWAEARESAATLEGGLRAEPGWGL